MTDSRVPDLMKRVARLELLERNRGDMFLFLVTTNDGKAEYLVTARSFESCAMLIPNQGTIEFLGVANRMYSRDERIIRVLSGSPAKVRANISKER